MRRKIFYSKFECFVRILYSLENMTKWSVRVSQSFIRTFVNQHALSYQLSINNPIQNATSAEKVQVKGDILGGGRTHDLGFIRPTL